ncbi:MAG: hypothetical protein OCC46_03585 [Pseudodesulfovibrio sp.]
MSTQPIEHKGYGYTYKKPRKPHEDVDFQLGPEQSKKRHEEVADSGPTIRDRIRNLLADVPRSDGTKLSFKDIVDHRDALEKDWDAAVAGDLTTLGVDMSVKFRLMHDPTTGEVQAHVDHPDKMKIDQYFASNPEMADDFENMLQLDKLIDVARRRLAPQEMDQTLEPEAMAWWFQTNMDTTSLFTGGGVIFGQGSSAYKGLDIRV